MAKKKSKLELAQEKAERAINETNSKIEELGKHTSSLYDALGSIQELFDAIRNVPSNHLIKYETLKRVRLEWKQQAQNIEKNFKNATVNNAGGGAAGVSAGIAVAALGPTAAMGIATTFGVASTGTAISTLSGAAATNAALAWLGGGALAAGGGGMVAGKALLALAGPVGWAIAGVALLGTGLLFWKAKSEKDRLENVFTLISERDTKSYRLAIVELSERIARIIEETGMLKSAIADIKTFGLDYSQMTEDQQYALGTYVNLMSSSTQLLVNPILGLQPKFTKYNLAKFEELGNGGAFNEKQEDLIITLANMLYQVPHDKKDSELLMKAFKKNKKFLEVMDLTKKDLDDALFEAVEKVLNKSN